jgi:hypothetical protein
VAATAIQGALQNVENMVTMFDSVYIRRRHKFATGSAQSSFKLAAAVIISSYLVTEDRTIEDDIIGGNWSEAATRDSYSSRMKFKARTKASCAESGLGMILCLFTFGDKGRERGSPILFCERSLGAMTDGWA